MTNVKHSMQSDQEKQKVDGWLPRAEETRLNGEQEARGTTLTCELIRTYTYEGCTIYKYTINHSTIQFQWVLCVV